jgi:hypothetical protein
MHACTKSSVVVCSLSTGAELMAMDQRSKRLRELHGGVHVGIGQRLSAEEKAG